MNKIINIFRPKVSVLKDTSITLLLSGEVESEEEKADLIMRAIDLMEKEIKVIKPKKNKV